MPLLLLLLFIGVPLGELALLLWIAEHTHWALPLAIVIVTGVIGVVMLRIQGVITFRKIRESLSAGKAPTDPLIDTGFFLLASGLLLTPGVVTDVFGLTLLFPPTRAAYRAAAKSWFKSRFQVVTWASGMGPGPDQPPANGDVIEGDVIEGEVVRED